MTYDGTPPLKPQNTKIIPQPSPFDTVQIAFYVKLNGKRTRKGIALDGFFINALKSIGVKREDVPQWVQSAIDEWSPFDAQLPLTRQVKYLIMVAVVKGLSGDDSFL